MTNYNPAIEAAEGVTITRQHAVRILAQHGLDDAETVAEFYATVSKSEDGLYNAADVFRFLNY
jgi:hypothetical protein